MMVHKFMLGDPIESLSANGWISQLYFDELESSGVRVRPAPPPTPTLFCPRKGEHIDAWCEESQCWTEVVVEKWDMGQRMWRISTGKCIPTSAMRPGLTWRPDKVIDKAADKEKSWVQRKSSSWVLQPPPRFIAEPARSSRTMCHECGLAIDLREMRLGVEQARISKGFFAKKTFWFHCTNDCFETQRTHGLHFASFEGKLSLPNQRVLKALLQSVVRHAPASIKINRIVGVTADPKMMAAACRIAVASDIRAFRDTFFADADVVVCPFTKTPLNLENVHVHHQKPFAFQEIVNTFVEDVGLQRVHFGEFCIQ
jgi:hypothetical protein